VKNLFLVFVFAMVLPLISNAAQGSFPTGPDQQMTPGELCAHPDSYRYPEHIPYCSRNVVGDLKKQIIRDYDSQLGYSIESMPRQDFKIDHLIPLCAGGANSEDNLWPQHKTIYAITDPMEPLICQKMSDGKLKQRDAVEMIKAGKLDLSKVPDIMARLQAL
jgi:hypothetical protein